LAKAKTITKFVPARRKFGMQDLWRVALWGLSATAALTLVAYAGTTEPGRERLHVAVAEIHEILIPSGAKPLRPLDAREGRRLAETVRVLAADRERLLDRVATLEQGLDGITGSIARVEKAVKAPPEAVSAPAEGDGIRSDLLERRPREHGVSAHQNARITAIVRNALRAAVHGADHGVVLAR